jgi:hypothetical protein
MGRKKDQHTVGTPAKPRGQQTGFAGNPDQNREAMEETPALRGRRKVENKMFGDASQQHIGSDATKPSTNSPSTPAMNTPAKSEAGGVGIFKQRLARTRNQERKQTRKY